jgi:hypothetical protein
MRTMRFAGLLTGCVLLAVSDAGPQGRTIATSAAPPIKTVNHSDPLRDMARARMATIKLLMEAAQAKIEKPIRTFQGSAQLNHTIRMLGVYRAGEAVNFLVNNVALQVPTVSTDIVPFIDYPCVQALIEIGSPSTAGIFHRLSPIARLVDPNPLKESDLHLFAYIIREIDGHEVGLFRLERELNGAKRTKQKENLPNLIEIYKRREGEFDIKKVLLVDEGGAGAKEGERK